MAERFWSFKVIGKANSAAICLVRKIHCVTKMYDGSCVCLPPSNFTKLCRRLQPILFPLNGHDRVFCRYTQRVHKNVAILDQRSGAVSCISDFDG